MTSAEGVIQVNVTVSDDYLEHFDQVVQGCQMVGLRVEQQLRDIGIVSGLIEAAKLPDLRRVKGVAHVEASGGIQIAPPESNIQ